MFPPLDTSKRADLQRVQDCLKRLGIHCCLNPREPWPDLYDPAVPSGVLFGLCGRLLSGFVLPDRDLVARGMCIGRIGQQFKIVLHMLDPKPGRPYCPSEAFTFHTSILSLAACASDASGTSSR